MVFASSNELSFDATEKKNEKNQNQRHVNPNWVTSHNPRHRLSGVIICELSTIYFLLLVFFTLVSLVCFSGRVLFGKKKKIEWTCLTKLEKSINLMESTWATV